MLGFSPHATPAWRGSEDVHSGSRCTTQVGGSLAGFRGDARLFKLSQPVKYLFGDVNRQTEHVVVSAVNAYSGPETYIFPADADGRVLDWIELPGSFRGGLDHAHALKGAGFELQSATLGDAMAAADARNGGLS